MRTNVTVLAMALILAIVVICAVFNFITLVAPFEIQGLDPNIMIRCSAVMFPDVNESGSWACAMARNDRFISAGSTFLVALVATASMTRSLTKNLRKAQEESLEGYYREPSYVVGDEDDEQPRH